jgi:hypothetical protein
MRSVFRVLTYLIAAEVVVQAAAVAYAVFGLGSWVDGGGMLDRATAYDEGSSRTGAVGFMTNGINGQVVILLLAITLLAVSFTARLPGGASRAGAVFVLVVLQVLFGVFGHDTPILGALQALSALILFSVAVAAGRRIGSTEMETS